MDGNLNALTTIFTEFYYWVTIVMMFLIHVGFCTYEVGVSRRRNHLKTLMKNAMAIPLVTVTFFLFGWWIYFAFVNGPGITGGLVSAPYAEPWNPLMAPHLSGVNPGEHGVTAANAALWSRLNGVFWGAFLLFSITTASIVPAPVHSGSSPCCSARYCGSSMRPGVGVRKAGWSSCGAIMTPMLQASFTPSRAGRHSPS
jgi:Amt family ammonium transporter